MDIRSFLNMLYAPIHDVSESKIRNELIKFSSSTGISIDTIVSALQSAVEDAVCRYYIISDNIFCDPVELYVSVELLVPEQISYEEVKMYYPKYSGEKKVNLDLYFEKFPDELQELTEERFRYYLYNYDEQALNERWKKRLHQVIDGEILSVNKDYIEVEVGYQKAIMEKKDFVPSEKKSYLYIRGSILKFYVSKNNYYPLKIFLSRSTKKLPQQLLVQKLVKQRMLGNNYPFYKFECTKRVIGKFSVIKSDAPFKTIRKFVNEVREELNNEKIIIVPIDKLK